MSSLCLNCQEFPAINGSDYCENCELALSETVDANNIANDKYMENYRVDVQRNFISGNPHMGHGIIDDEGTIEQEVQFDNENNSRFWWILLVIAFLLIWMIVYYIK